MKVLFIASGNKNGELGKVVKNQFDSLSNFVALDYYLIKGHGYKGYLKNVLPLIKTIRSRKIDVIHSHYSLSAFVTTLSLIFNSKKIPHIVSLMGSDALLSKWNKFLVQIFHKYFWSKTLVKSNRMKYDLELDSIEIIPNGVDLEKINKLKNNLNNIKNGKTILFAADPSRESKNYTLTEQAFNLIDDNEIELKVVYNVSHEVILSAILNCSVLILTSKWEGSPNIIKEAMACNCPVVSTNVGDVEWLFGDEPGHFLTSFESNDVAEKIKLALNFVEEKGRTNGRERIVELGLDSETVARRIVKVYEQSLESKGSGAARSYEQRT